MFNNLDKNQKILFIICISCMLLVVVFYFFSFIKFSSSSTSEDSLNFEANVFSENSNSEFSENNSPIVIYITGEVNSPGVFSLPKDSRIKDAIESAGGLTKSADISKINLAFVLSDGQKIYIPSEDDSSDTETISSDDGIAIVYDNYDESNFDKKININTATQTQLETLPRNRPFYRIKNN